MTVTKIDPRVNRTRHMLEQALSQLLTEKPFTQITVQDITAKADLNRATFYAHFEDKYSLLNYSVRKTFQAMLEAKLPPDPRLSRQTLQLLGLTACEYSAAFIGRCVSPAQGGDHGLMMAQVQSLTYDTLLDWATQNQHPQAQTVALVGSWAIFGAAFQWVQQGQGHSAEDWMNDVLEVLLSGQLI
jgi:AcrR family transcriptional regulator